MAKLPNMVVTLQLPDDVRVTLKHRRAVWVPNDGDGDAITLIDLLLFPQRAGAEMAQDPRGRKMLIAASMHLFDHIRRMRTDGRRESSILERGNLL